MRRGELELGPPPPEVLAVVVPAHDEEDRIARCLRALDRALDHPALEGLERLVVVALDDCNDRTGERAGNAVGQRGRLLLEECRATSAGAARRLGFERVLERSQGLDPRAVWLATTDADSQVPPDWLARQLAWRRAGAQAVAGTVTVGGWREQPPHHGLRFQSFQRLQGTGHGHPHVHGANLGFSAEAYLGAGGMPALRTGEDHALWSALREGGYRTLSAPDLPVVTSARREARAPGGFSDFLRLLGSGR